MTQRRERSGRQRSEEGRFRTPVRGYRFAARPPGADHPRAGQRVLLHHERGHPVDEWAVAIWTRSDHGLPWRIGYLDRSVAARIGPRVRRGDRITGEVVGWMTEPDGRWRRPVIEVDRVDIEPRADADAPAAEHGADAPAAEHGADASAAEPGAGGPAAEPAARQARKTA